MKITSVDDIERKKEAKEREQFKTKISGDIKDVFDNLFKPEPEPREPDKKPIKKKFTFWTFIKWLGLLFLLLLLLILILGSIWLLKALITDLF